MSVRARRTAAVAFVALAACLVPAGAEAAPPVADSGPDVTVPAGTDAVLHGAVSDPDGDALEIHWMATVVGAGDESSCTFTGPWTWAPETPEGLNPTLNCTVPGAYLLQLVVGDGTSSDDDTGALITFTEPDLTPATCKVQVMIKGGPTLRLADAQSGVSSFTVLDTYNLLVKPASGTFSPAVRSVQIAFARPGRGAGMVLISHENGSGVAGECVLLVRRNGTTAVAS